MAAIKSFMIPCGAMLLCLIVCPALVSATTFHVAPDGNDKWSGTLERPNATGTDGPLVSLQGARDTVRRVKAIGPLSEPVRVIVAAGTYRLGETFVLEPSDSGTEKCPITYEAASQSRPVFSGGRQIQGFKKGPDGVWSVQVPEVKAGKWYFEQLYVDGRRATRAREPNKFYYYVRQAVTQGTDPATGKPADLRNRAFVARAKDIAPLAAIPKDRLSDVTIVAYQSWESSLHRIASLDTKTGTIITTGNAPWPFNQWGPNQRYQVENYRAALDSPGEWFLDRDGTLSYIPLPGQDMARAEVVAPVVSGLVRFAGDPGKGQYVEHIAIRGLAFEHDAYTVEPQGHGDGQAAVTAPTTVLADGTRNVTIERCEVAHTGGYGVWFRRACRECRVVGNLIHDLGAGGVRVGQGWENDNPGEADATGRIVVDNNIIHSGGHLFRGAVGVWIGHSAHSVR